MKRRIWRRSLSIRSRAAPGWRANQFNFFIAIEKAGDVNIPARQISRIVKAAGITAVSRDAGTNPKPHPVAVTPLAAHGTHAEQNVPCDFFRPGRLPDPLGANLPTAAVV